ncbi:hypothetical protein NIES2101_33450 [Calothrix sp. HK-06]|nr:hypothetical protein NIES2101_33450 [Calothrix sp. HK-06]
MALNKIIKKSQSETARYQAAESLWKMGTVSSVVIDELNCILQNSKSDFNRLVAAFTLLQINPDNLEAIQLILDLMSNIKEDNFLIYYDEFLKEIRNSGVLQKVLINLRNLGMDDKCRLVLQRYDASEVIRHSAQMISYPNFYHAWHGEFSPPEILEKQFINIALQPTDKTHPIYINAQALRDEIDISAISQEICNQIYFADVLGAEPPEVNNAPQVKRLIPKIKKQLQTQNLAIILNNCQPNQELIAFCRKISDVVSIGWITDEPLEAPLRRFPPNQPNLLNAIQSWINEIE